MYREYSANKVLNGYKKKTKETESKLYFIYRKPCKLINLLFDDSNVNIQK